MKLKLFVISLLFIPSVTSAAALTQDQVSAIVALLRAFNVDQATIQIVETQLAPRITFTPTQTTTPVLGTQTYQVTTPSPTPTITLVEDRPAPQPVPVVEVQPVAPPADTTAPKLPLLQIVTIGERNPITDVGAPAGDYLRINASEDLDLSTLTVSSATLGQTTYSNRSGNLNERYSEVQLLNLGAARSVEVSVADLAGNRQAATVYVYRNDQGQAVGI